METNDKSVHVETESKTRNVETDMAEQNSQHVETPTVLHVVMTDSTLPSNANAAVHAPTVDKVEPATSENKAEEPPPAPVPPQHAKKDCLPTTNNCVLKH